MELVLTVFCSRLHQKELRLLEFLLRAYLEGAGLCLKLGDAAVAPLLRAERHVLGEAHLLRGFVRFSDVGGALVSVISPKNYVLPFIANYFISRYDKESFMIFDKTNKAALVYQNANAEILKADSIDFPGLTEDEARYRALWKHFYDTVAIAGRENPKCRRSHMPKRYWENMPEMKDQN